MTVTGSIRKRQMVPMMSFAALAVALLATALAAAPAQQPGDEFFVETVATALETPWAMAFTPDGRLLVTERPGRIRVVNVDSRTLQPEPWATLDVVHVSESGLMGIAVDPPPNTGK